MKNFLTELVILLSSLILIAIFALLMGLPVMWLWNWIMPTVFALGKITFWKAVGINLLCGLLFRGKTTVHDN